jgi:hypothetical protein
MGTTALLGVATVAVLGITSAVGFTVASHNAAGEADRPAVADSGEGTDAADRAPGAASVPGARSGGRTSDHPSSRDGQGTDPDVQDADRWADIVVVSARGSLPDGYAARVAAEPTVGAASVVYGETLELVGTESERGRVVDELPAGWRFPVEVLAVDPASYAEVMGVPEVLDLAADEAVLSESSAEVRRARVGATLTFVDGTRLRVAAVLPDQQVGVAEVLVTTDSDLAVTTERYLLAAFDAEHAARAAWRLERLGEEPVVVERSGEVPILRHAAGVTAPARLKLHFGEFAISDGPGRFVQQGQSWLDEYHAYGTVPLLGRMQCHRDMFEPLSAAMQELIDRGLASLVDPSDFGGCWSPRTTSGATLSSHAWGIAVDLNVSGNHLGADPTMPREVIDVMAAHGFVWGGDWLVPDGMHFELAPDRDTRLTD